MWNINLFLAKLYKKSPVIAYDIVSIPFAWFLAYWLRYNFHPSAMKLFSSDSLKALMIVICVQTASYYYFRVYRGLWRFSSVNDVIRIIKSVLTATLLVTPVLYFSFLLYEIPRSVLCIYAILLITFLCGGRLSMRAWRDRHHENAIQVQTNKRVLIIGAGRAGESLVRDLKRTNSYIPVGLVDDSPSKRGLDIHGVRVLGGIKDLPAIVEKNPVELIFIAIPTAKSAAMRRIVELCEQCKIPFRTLPGLSALASGFVQVRSLRDVSIEDLLGRDEVQVDWRKIASNLQDKRVVVTGGGGSIGSELCRQVLAFNPKKLLIIDNSEFNLYTIEQELRQSYPDSLIEIALISVTDPIAIKEYFRRFAPQVVFHAAAYKHVPMLEQQIRVAVKNNVLGTKTVAEASVAVGVDKFILISTDKAVNPTNVMGTTKRVAEIYCQNLNERVDTQFITVRFGNVLGSAGSVVPLFKKQLEAGGPLTVTHPDIQRYFMTIPEACQLIMQAMVNGEGGEIFVLDMGEPIKIRYLAEQIIQLAGKVPGKDIEIKFTGLRPGEKLFEELFHETEQLMQTNHEKLYQAKFRKVDWQELKDTFYLLNAACVEHNDDELYILIKSLVPEFKSETNLVV
jgi:FlaA1/EpsC-like NDP-sugar epimerase